MARNNWTREEHILAFNLYCQIPFGTIHLRNPRIIELAKLLGRKVGAVSWKLANFARLDPALQERGVRGASHGGKGEDVVWDEFSSDPEGLALESQRLLAGRLGKSIEELSEIETSDLPKEGVEREAIVRQRVNQDFFRRRVLSAYNFVCCVTGLSVQSLLVASHIVPWADDKANRLNPRNGLSLNGFHDRAFDRHLMWVDEEFRVRFAPRLLEQRWESAEMGSWVVGAEGKHLLLPKKFAPDPVLLKQHAQACLTV